MDDDILDTGPRATDGPDQSPHRLAVAEWLDRTRRAARPYDADTVRLLDELRGPWPT